MLEFVRLAIVLSEMLFVKDVEAEKIPNIEELVELDRLDGTVVLPIVLLVMV